MHNEFFPPTKEELEKIIKELEAQLEDDACPIVTGKQIGRAHV